MKSETMIIAVLVIALIGLLAYPSLKATGDSVKLDKNVFEGIITNMNLEPQIFEGTGVYDRSCNMIGGGLTNCDAGIQTEKGLLNFNYKHNMNIQPCISEGENLEVEILEGGKARVTRK